MTESDSILMIEDDDGHARLIEKNMRRSGLTNPIHRFADGTSAMDALFERPSGEELKPSLILLDLNLPDISGIDVLKRIKGDPSVRLTPVIILTTTDDTVEVQRCYDLGCNVYFVKPLADQSFATVIHQVGQLMAVMQLPQPLSAGPSHP